MRRRASWSVVLIAAMVGSGRAAAPVDADAVEAALARGRAWLLDRPDFLAAGNWEYAPNAGRNNQPAGLTALATYALLASGLSGNDPRLRPPLAYLRGFDMRGTYALGLRAQVWQYLPRTKGNAIYVARDGHQLLRNIQRDAAQPNAGLFGYVDQPTNRIDLSASQYGTLGLWASERMGAEVPSATWRAIDRRWKALQDPETGGWAYGGDRSVTLSMTTAGVATLYITLDHLAGPPLDEENAAEAAIDRGIAFIAERLPSLFDNGSGGGFYTIYGIERIGVAGAYKLIGGVDWYAAGASYLLRAQSADGSWSGEWGPEVDTCFAMLFLARGREPVLMNKLKYLVEPGPPATRPVEGRWNLRGRDVANAASFVGRQLERSFNWQIVDLDASNVRDLHDAPIAYLSFRLPEVPSLSPDAMDKLRRYVESGGMLVVNGDCPPRRRAALAAATTQATTRPDALANAGVARFLAELFPFATLRRLPGDHPILRNQQFRAGGWQTMPVVYELTNGVRTLALFLADDAGRAWHEADEKKSREKFELIADAYQYAIDKEHAQVKGRTYYVEPTTQPTTVPAKQVRVARLKFEGNWDPEPGGWRRLRALAHRESVLIDVATVDLAAGGTLDGFAIAHLTGVGPFKLPQAAVDELGRFVAAGGTLLIDAAGGDATFGQGVERALGAAMPALRATSQPARADDAIFAGDRPIAFRYRTFAIATIGPQSTPRLRVSRVGPGVVIYSPDDLTVGLVGQPVDGIRGYAPEVATEIVMRLIRRAAR